jgi:hypothetical protein
MELENRNNQERLEDLVSAWLGYYQELQEGGNLSGQASPDSPYYWAIDALDDICRSQPELCWTLILRLSDRATLDLQLSSIAAGPLEDLLSRNGIDFIERIEIEANQNEKIKNILNWIWRNTIEFNVWDRIQRFRQ